MIGTVLLNYTDNIKQVEDEEKNRFIRNLLEQMGIPIAEIWTDDNPLSTAQKHNLLKMLAQYNIHVIDDMDGLLRVYVDGEEVGSFEKPTYKLKRDLSQLEPRKQLYIEMTIVFNSLFEDSEI